MRSLLTRAASQSTCRCVSCLSTTANGVASRSAGAASKKRLRIGNSVTALYTSIFAAAALADARAKAQRRHDWEEKIAAVKAEVNELVDEEQRILESLQSRRSNTRGLSPLLQTRGLGTVTNLSPRPQRVTPSRPTRSFHTERRLLNAADARSSETLLKDVRVSEPDDLEQEDIELYVAMKESIPAWVIHDVFRMKAIQKLALRQFAIRLLLRPMIAHRYSAIPMNYQADFQLPNINVGKLFEELNDIRHRIERLKTNKSEPFDDVIREYASNHPDLVQLGRDRLDAELDQDIQSFMSKQMSLQELLLRISSNLLNSVDPNRPAAFRYILIAFTQARQNDLCDLLLRTLFPNYFYLSTSLITTIISFYRKSKNLKDFDLFIQMLCGQSYSANLGTLGHWRRRKMNGLDLVVPPLDSNNPVLYSELVATTLRFDQPDRADAYLQAARRAGFFDNFHTLHSYIRFYSIRQDWEKGITALRRAITYLVSSTDHSRQRVERMILLMVHLCDSCNRPDVSEVLIFAAMHNGLDPRIPSSGMDVVPIVDRSNERWLKAAKSTPKENLDRPLWQKCNDFAEDFGHHLDALEQSKDESRSKLYDKFLACYTQHAMSSAFATNIPQHQLNKDEDALLSKLQSQNAVMDGKAQAQSVSNEEFLDLKEEVTQLRDLVFQLRKHHIETSFNEDSAQDLEQEEFLSERDVTASSNSTSEPPNSSVSVEFERISEMIRGAEPDPSTLSQNEFQRSIGMQQKRLRKMANSLQNSLDPTTQGVSTAKGKAKELHTKSEDR